MGLCPIGPSRLPRPAPHYPWESSRPLHTLAQAMTRAPAISVVMCTRDRPADLRLALHSLIEQAIDSHEIIVIDQSTTDETEQIVAEAANGGTPVRYTHLSTPGLSRAYNSGIASARGELLAFTDDDCIAPPNWLAAIQSAFATDPEVALIYGQVLLPPELQEREGSDGVTPQLLIRDRRRLGPKDGFMVFGMGANFAARRSSCKQIQGFDEVLGGGGPLQSAQDFDFAYRLFRAGFAILLEPTVVVYHRGFRPLGDWPAVVGSYGIGVGGFYWKHVRARDPYAAALLAKMLLRECAGVVHKVLMRRAAGIQWKYVTSVFSGIRRSHRFRVDLHRRLYAAPRGAGANS